MRRTSYFITPYTNIFRIGQKLLLTGVFAWLVWKMLELTLPYFAFRDDIGFLRLKPTAIRVVTWKIAFYIHVFSSILVLIISFFQLLLFKAKTNYLAHKYLGLGYAVGILAMAAPSGLVMGFYAEGGLVGQAGFVTLSLAWWYFTYQGLRAAMQKRWAEHKAFKIRSFALTLSAITLRGYMFLAVAFSHADPDAVYTALAWLSWLPNLAVAEWWNTRRLTTT